jgi:hypothetical protein
MSAQLPVVQVTAKAYFPPFQLLEANRVLVTLSGGLNIWTQRACVGVGLDEGYLIEVVVIATVL